MSEDNTQPPNRNCLELSMEYSSASSPARVAWSLDSASSAASLAIGELQPNETSSTICWEDDFDCAALDIFYIEPQDDGGNDNDDVSSYGMVRVLWNGVVWAYEPFHRGQRPLVWFGDECHKHRYQVCEDYNDDKWLLDVEVSTSTDAEDSSVYWRVYANFGSGDQWGNLVQDPYYRRYQPDTTYRSLQCLERGFGQCTEFGLAGGSESFVSNLAIRVDGKLKTNTRECNHFLCEGDIVTPLQKCRSLSDEEIAGIVIGVCVLVPVLLVCFACAWYSLRSQPACNPDQSGDE